MPKLSHIGNSDAVDSSYAARAIVYVEAEADSDVFARIVGMSGAQVVDFKAPLEGGSGYTAVCSQVDLERRRGNCKVFGLVDGEAAASLGNLCELIEATSATFPLSRHNGVFCLADHELENLLLRYGDVCGFLVMDVALAHLSSRSRTEIEKTLRRLTRRFFSAALLKYAALHLRYKGDHFRPVDVGRFQDRAATTKCIRAALRQDICQSGLDWHIFRDQVLAIVHAVRRRFHDEGLSMEERSFHMLRLSDGKGLMSRLRSEFNASKRMDGHLVDKLVSSKHAGILRDEILEIVGGVSA